MLLLIVVTSFNSSCSNQLLYIENEHYFKINDLTINNLKVGSIKLKFLHMFNDTASYEKTKNHIAKLQPSYLNKYDILIVFLYPHNAYNSNIIKNYFELIEDFYQFLKTNERFPNNLYTIGISQNNNNFYKVLIYLKEMPNY